MNRIARLATVVTTLVISMALSTSAALAYIQPPQPAQPGGSVTVAPPVVQTGGSGVGAWTLAFIALAAIVAGMLFAQLPHAIRRHSHKVATV